MAAACRFEYTRLRLNPRRHRAHKLRFRPAPKGPDLTAEQILAWVDQYEARFGRWPMKTDGRRGLTDTTWSAVDACLKGGHRGLPGGSSLPKVIAECGTAVGSKLV